MLNWRRALSKLRSGSLVKAPITLIFLLLIVVVPSAYAIEPRVECEQSVALGVFVGGPPGVANLNEFAGLTGVSPSFVTWYQDWVGTTGFVQEQFDAARAEGATPMLTWEPKSYSRYGGATYQPEYALRTILAGDHDFYIRQTARDMKAWGEPIYLRFAHEMNAGWYPWGVGVNCEPSNPEACNSAEQYVAVWRHVHDVFRHEGATNVRWVWSPNVRYGTATYASLYPGDDYVDWVAIDGYNWGVKNAGRWTSFSEVFGSSYYEITNLTAKPLMIAETGSAEKGGDKAAWIRQGLLEDVPKRFPRVRAVLWFDMDRERSWSITSSRSSLIAYREVANSPMYQGRLP